MEIIKVVLTGGPCAGKSTALNSIKEYLSKNNIKYITIQETATEFLLNGKEFDKKRLFQFQSSIFDLQFRKEQNSEIFAQQMFSEFDKCVIICDRGLLDNKAYLDNPYDFQKIASCYDLSEIEILDGYNLVLDLLSLATCKKEAYNFNNKARKEDVDAARALDLKTSLAWINHRNMKIIDSSMSLEEETNVIIDAIKDILVGVQVKYIRKYLVDDSISNYNVYEDDDEHKYEMDELAIIDYYIKGDNKDYNYVVSVRKYKNEFSYVYSVYTYVDNRKIIIEDRQLSYEEYCGKLLNGVILEKKKRSEFNFLFDNQVCKLCRYDDKTILEIEQNNLQRDVSIPYTIPVIKEIKNDDKTKRRRLF